MAKDIAALTWDIWYLANKEYVVAKLCENKAKPEMHCNGKCHLAKQLEKLEEPAPAPGKQKIPAPRAAKLGETTWISGPAFPGITIESPVTAETSDKGWIDLTEATRSFSSGIFHPPIV
jgi:hypothetical protein